MRSANQLPCKWLKNRRAVRDENNFSRPATTKPTAGMVTMALPAVAGFAEEAGGSGIPGEAAAAAMGGGGGGMLARPGVFAIDSTSDFTSLACW